MAIERVNGFMTSDGKYFPSHQQDQADKHEADLQFRKWCEDNICKGGEWSARMVADEILEYWKPVKLFPDTAGTP
jgi:hypothetical protein